MDKIEKDLEDEEFIKLERVKIPKELDRTSEKPFQGEWEDFLTGREEDKKNYVVTFITMKRALFDFWQDVTVGGKDFDIDNLLTPGVYRDDMINKDGSKYCYTAVIDNEVLMPHLCKEKLDIINRIYGEMFEFSEEVEDLIDEKFNYGD